MSFASSAGFRRKAFTTGSKNCAVRWLRLPGLSWFRWILFLLQKRCCRFNTGRRTKTACRCGYRCGCSTAPFTADSMIDLTKVSNYYIACGYTDLPLDIDGLAAVVTQQYGSHLDEESMFLFCRRRTDRIKALYWCGDGYILLYMRLSNGRFQWSRL